MGWGWELQVLPPRGAAPGKSNQQPILVHPAWAPRPEAATLSPAWIGEANPLGCSLPLSCHFNIFREEKDLKSRDWGTGEKSLVRALR